MAQLERVLERGERGSIDRSILFVGDSLTLQFYEAARCTLPSKFHDALEYYDVEALVDFRKTLARMKRGVVLLNIGLKFGPGEREQLRGRADELVGELERWSSTCGDACVAIVATATTQHFSTARDRVWRGHNSSSPSASRTSRWAAAARRCRVRLCKCSGCSPRAPTCGGARR